MPLAASTIRAVPCPTCQAKSGQPCTAPVTLPAGRIDVHWFHSARSDLAAGWT